MEYIVTLSMKILDDCASFYDFEREMEQFNEAYRGKIKIRVLNCRLKE